MDSWENLPLPVHVTAALCVVLLLALAGRTAARWLRQPEVVGEVLVGLLVGPVVLVLSDRAAFDALLPADVLDVLELIGQTGLVLYLVGLAHRLRPEPGSLPRRRLAAVVTGAFGVPLISGLLLVWFIAATGDSAARGDVPLPSFVLMVAVAMSITAVPVLSRILGDRGLSDSTEGKLALATGIVMDSLGWFMLMVAIGLSAGDLSGLWRSALALLAGGGCALLVHFGLRSGPARRLCRRAPGTTAVLIGGAALGTALLTERLGMTAIVGAALVGLAIPHEALAPWHGPVAAVSRAGRALTPVFFVVTGVSVLIRAFASAPWTLIAATFALGCVSKLLGGWAGARLGGMRPDAARRIGVLMNTRGLTELIVLEVGHRAGILPGPLVLALVVMALATTAMTGPMLSLLDRAERRSTTPIPSEVPRPVATEGSTS
ncbi:cation:proton antiporter [Streptomyces daqingensis]|uniref:cation:proton antiporter n=1 Tax=Streptomyces daqingensis TaxID=1472640 RepID=UPI00166AC048|nr:cation:proton antiporter [Streptomyces daqingensis]